MFEGIALNARWMLQVVERFVRSSRPDGLASLRFIGGGARSALWCQTMADVLNIEIHQIADPVLANARGAALISGVGIGALGWHDVPSRVALAGIYRPDPAVRAVHDRQFAAFTALYRNIVGSTRGTTGPWHRSADEIRAQAKSQRNRGLGSSAAYADGDLDEHSEPDGVGVDGLGEGRSVSPVPGRRAVMNQQQSRTGTGDPNDLRYTPRPMFRNRHPRGTSDLLAAAATFGILTAFFQWGCGTDTFGLGRAGPIESFLPVVILAILFGLSTDYQVFLVSRMHEEWTRTGDNATAVRTGQVETGRVITAAATIRISVFLTFAFLGQRDIAEFGIGLAAAVAVDAFILRTVLVPGAMHLFGDANWWLPRWLVQRLPHLAIEPPDHPSHLQAPLPAAAEKVAVLP